MTLQEANKYLKFTDEEMTELLALEARINSDSELSKLREDAWREIYVDDASHPEWEIKYNKLVPEDAFNGLFYVLVGVLNMDYVVEFYNKKGISLDILSHTLQDTTLWVRNYTRHNGRLGLASRYWISLGFAGKVFRLGRMEFEMTTIKEDYHSPQLSQGDLALEGHVPQGEPLDHDACVESYKAAFPFFEKYFNYHAKAVHLVTWMLSTAIMEILPPESNVVKWANDVTIIPADYKKVDFARFIFGTKEFDIKTAPRNTSMQRRICEYLENGGEIINRAGYILKDTVMSW